MDSVLYLGLAAIYAVLFLYGCVLLRRDSSPGLRYLLLIVTAGLVWDNAVIGIGKYMGRETCWRGLTLRVSGCMRWPRRCLRSCRST